MFVGIVQNVIIIMSNDAIRYDQLFTMRNI